MSVNVKTYCRDCIHEKVCRNTGRPELFQQRLCDTNYGSGPNDDYGYDEVSDSYNISIDISCNDFDKRTPVTRSEQVGRLNL